MNVNPTRPNGVNPERISCCQVAERAALDHAPDGLREEHSRDCAKTKELVSVHKPMNGAELQMVRAFLGLPVEWLAAQLGVQIHSIRGWEAGDKPVPGRVSLAIRDLEAATGEAVGDAIAELLDANDVAALTYRCDMDYQAAYPDTPWPASWHRAVIARVAQEVPGLVIRYAPRAWL